MKVKYSSDELREKLSEVLGGDWREGAKDDGHFYKDLSLMKDACSLKVDIREFLSAEFGGTPDSWVLHWDAYNWRYTVESV